MCVLAAMIIVVSVLIIRFHANIINIKTVYVNLSVTFFDNLSLIDLYILCSFGKCHQNMRSAKKYLHYLHEWL